MTLSEISIAELQSAPGEIQELARRLPFDVDDREPDDRVLYAVGSVELDELVLPPNTGVLVTGDLVVRGVLDDRPLCSDPENVRYLVVAGDLRARTVLLGSEAFVDGSVIVEGDFIAESDGDYTLHVGGNLEGRILVALGHHVEVAGETKADFAIGFLGLQGSVAKSQMATSFVDDLVNQWGGIDVEEVARRALACQPFLKREI